MKLSIVDLGTIAPGTNESDALADSLQTACHADAAGFHRIWFAEHHLSAMGASHHPELLMAAAGARTHGIRLGSGSVLLNNYSPFKIAEMFKQLEAMYPGRVDLGMGRATSGPVIDLALRRDRQAQPVDDHQQQVAETVAWLYGAFPEDHPFAGNPLMPSVASVPQAFLLGSSPSGSTLAAGLGIGYTFAGFINPAAAAHALQAYRTNFQPQGFGLEKPHAILAVNVTVGENPAEAAHLVGSAKGYYARLRSGNRKAMVPAADVAANELSRQEQDQPTSIVDGQWPQFVAGSPGQVRATLEEMIAQSGADEVMIQNMIADPADRRRSHTLLAQMFNLNGRGPADAVS